MIEPGFINVTVTVPCNFHSLQKHLSKWPTESCFCMSSRMCHGLNCGWKTDSSPYVGLSYSDLARIFSEIKDCLTHRWPCLLTGHLPPHMLFEPHLQAILEVTGQYFDFVTARLNASCRPLAPPPILTDTISCSIIFLKSHSPDLTKIHAKCPTVFISSGAFFHSHTFSCAWNITLLYQEF